MRSLTIIHPEAPEGVRRFVDEIEGRFASPEGRVIYKARNEIKVFESEEFLRPINVKQYAVPKWYNRPIYSYLRSPKALRAYRYAVELLRRGIKTPPPLACVIKAQGRMIGRSYLVTYQMPYLRDFYEFRSSEVGDREPIVRGLGRFAAAMHEQGVLHLDFSPGNILFRTDEDGEPDFCLVDINRMRFGSVSLRKGCRSFARLWGRADFLDLLAEGYAAGRGFDEGAVRCLIHRYHAAFWCGRSDRPF